MQRTERDAWIMESLAKMRFASTRQIARLHFNGSLSPARRRLRQLLDARLVRVWMRSLNADNLYSLTPTGREMLEQPDGVRCPRRLDGQIEHPLAINTLRIEIAIGLDEGGAEIAWWRSDWELRAHRGQRTVPDAMFAVRGLNPIDQAFALEVEYGTRAPRSLQKKLLRYRTANYRRDGIYRHANPIVLVVVKEPKWLDRYRDALASMRLPIATGLAGLSEIERNGAIGPVWMTVEGDKPMSLRALANRYYGNDRSWPENAGGTGCWRVSPAHNPTRHNVENLEDPDSSVRRIQ